MKSSMYPLIVWGDHGWHLGDHLVWGKHTLFERALKAALVIRVPGITDGDIVTKVVSSSDIYPTIIDLCGLEMPHPTDGKSLLSILRDTEAQWEEAAYGYFRNGVTLRTERYRLTKYFRDQQPVVELYDHGDDPDETRNIAQDRPDLVEQLWPSWEKGNTGLFD